MREQGAVNRLLLWMKIKFQDTSIKPQNICFLTKIKYLYQNTMNVMLISNALQIRYSDFGESVGVDAFSYFDKGNVSIFRFVIRIFACIKFEHSGVLG